MKVNAKKEHLVMIWNALLFHVIVRVWWPANDPQDHLKPEYYNLNLGTRVATT